MTSPGDIDIPAARPAPTIERKIGSTTYIVTAQYSKTATENAAQKMKRIILKNIKKVS